MANIQENDRGSTRISFAVMRGRLVTTPSTYERTDRKGVKIWAEAVLDISSGLGDTPNFMGTYFPGDLIDEAMKIIPGQEVLLVGKFHVKFINDADGYPASRSSLLRVSQIDPENLK